MFLPNKVSYRIPVLDGGLNTTWTDLSCPPHMSPDLLNVDFGDVGSVKSAMGYKIINDTALSAPIDGLASVYVSSEDTEYLVVVSNNNVYHTSNTAFTCVSGGTGIFTSGVDVCIVKAEDQLYMTNGYAKPHRLVPGASACLYQIGVPVLSAPTAAYSAGTGGSITTGSRNYGIAGLNANGTEGNVITLVSNVWVNSPTGNIELTGIPDYPVSAGVVTKYLYRTTAGGNTFYRVTALTAGQSAYLDTAADGSISIPAQYDNNQPEACKWYWYHRGRMYAAGDPNYPQRVYYSAAGYPEVWPATNYIDIGKGDGLPITGIRIVGNSLCVHKVSHDGSQASMWIIYMPDSVDVTDASNWYVIKSPSAYAAIGNKAMDYMENMLAFLDKRGLYVWTGEQIAPGPAQAQAGQYLAMDRSADISTTIDDFRFDLLDRAAMINYDEKLWIAVPYGKQSETNDHILTYDYSVTSKTRGQGAWSLLSGPEINNFGTYNGKLVAGSATDGYIYELDTARSSNNDAIYSYFRTIHIAGLDKHWEMTKIWRYLWITVDTPGNWHLEITWWVDKSISETGSASVCLSGDGSEWNNTTWDTAVWDSGVRRKTIRVPLTANHVVDGGKWDIDEYDNCYWDKGRTITGACVGKTIQFRFATNASDIWWALYRLEIEYNLRSRRE